MSLSLKVLRKLIDPFRSIDCKDNIKFPEMAASYALLDNECSLSFLFYIDIKFRHDSPFLIFFYHFIAKD